MARPRINVDIALVLRLRDVNHLGWTRMADKYRELTGQYVSRDTIKRRYNEAYAKKVKRSRRRFPAVRPTQSNLQSVLWPL